MHSVCRVDAGCTVHGGSDGAVPRGMAPRSGEISGVNREGPPEMHYLVVFPSNGSGPRMRFKMRFRAWLILRLFHS